MRFYTSFRDIASLLDIFTKDECKGIAILCLGLSFCLIAIAFSSFSKGGKK